MRPATACHRVFIVLLVYYSEYYSWLCDSGSSFFIWTTRVRLESLSSYQESLSDITNASHAHLVNPVDEENFRP